MFLCGRWCEIYDTAKRTGMKVQVGSQGSSDLKYHKAAELAKAGDLGQLVMLQGSYMRKNWGRCLRRWTE